MTSLINNPSAPLSTSALTEALQQQIEFLIRQFNTLVKLATSDDANDEGSPDEDGKGLGKAPSTLAMGAVQTYRITAETQALITSIEGMTSLTRRMKEAWVFGELEAIGASKEAEARTQELAKEVAQLLANGSQSQDGEQSQMAMA